MSLDSVFSESPGKKETIESQSQRQKEEEEEGEIPIITNAVLIPNDEIENPPPMNPGHIVPYSKPSDVITTHPQQLTRPIPYYNLGRNPTGLQCPYCKRQMVTVVRDIIGLGTLVAVFLLALFFWPLCWLPFCIPSCRRTHHFCGHSECRQRVGETSVCA